MEAFTKAPGHGSRPPPGHGPDAPARRRSGSSGWDTWACRRRWPCTKPDALSWGSTSPKSVWRRSAKRSVTSLPADRERLGAALGRRGAVRDQQRAQQDRRARCPDHLRPDAGRPAPGPRPARPEGACSAVCRHARAGQTIILTSTTYVGTTRDLLIKPLIERDFVLGGDIYVAFSPERIDPANTDFPQETVPRVLGGATPPLRPGSPGGHRHRRPQRPRRLLARSGGDDEALREHLPGRQPDPGERDRRGRRRARPLGAGDRRRRGDQALRLHALPSGPRRRRALHPLRPPLPALAAAAAPLDATGGAGDDRDRAAAPPRRRARGRGARERRAGAWRTPASCCSASPTSPASPTCRESSALTLIDLLHDRGARVEYHDPLVPVLERRGETLISVTDPEPGEYDLMIAHTLHPEFDYSLRRGRRTAARLHLPPSWPQRASVTGLTGTSEAAAEARELSDAGRHHHGNDQTQPLISPQTKTWLRAGLVLLCLAPVTVLLGLRLARFTDDPIFAIYGVLVLFTTAEVMFVAFSFYRDPSKRGAEVVSLEQPLVSCLVACKDDVDVIARCVDLDAGAELLEHRGAGDRRRLHRRLLRGAAEAGGATTRNGSRCSATRSRRARSGRWCGPAPPRSASS